MDVDTPGNDVRLVRFVIVYQDFRGSTPTLREVADALCLASTNSVRYWLKVCERKGWITRRLKVSRGINVTRKGRKESVA